MRTMALLGLILSCDLAVQAQHPPLEIDWAVLAKEGRLGSGEVVSVEGRRCIRIVSTQDVQSKLLLTAMTNFPPLGTRYGITGEIKYEGVVADGYLELLSTFPAQGPGSKESQYFSRTLGVTGGMAKLSGSSDRRPFLLPFDRTGATSPPSKLELSLVLAGRGSVLVGPCRLVDYGDSSWPGSSSSSGAWWSPQTSGLLGGILGGGIGCFAPLLAMLAAKGRARGFVLQSLLVLTVLGGLAVLTGVVAVVLHQPYEVWFLLLLVGGLLVSIMPVRLRQFRRRYEEMELRRIAAADSR